MDYALLVLTVICFSIQTISFKEFNRRYMKNLASYFLFNTIYFSVIVLIYLAVNREAEPLSTVTVILAVAFGVLFMLTILLYMKAMELGPLSYSSMISSMGLLVPVVFGTFFWQETISILQLFGLLMLFITLILGSRSSGGLDDQKSKTNMRWLIFIIANLFGNGAIMTVSKAQQMIMPGREIEEFLIIAFGTAAILSFLLFLYRRFRLGERIGHLKQGPFVVLVLVTSTTTAFGNQIGLYLSGRIPAIIQFPSVSGGIVLMSTLFAVLFYKEHLTRTKILGLLSGLAALVLLSLR